jgi:hypothetical protein
MITINFMEYALIPLITFGLLISFGFLISKLFFKRKLPLVNEYLVIRMLTPDGQLKNVEMKGQYDGEKHSKLGDHNLY